MQAVVSLSNSELTRVTCGVLSMGILSKAAPDISGASHVNPVFVAKQKGRQTCPYFSAEKSLHGLDLWDGWSLTAQASENGWVFPDVRLNPIGWDGNLTAVNSLLNLGGGGSWGRWPTGDGGTPWIPRTWIQALASGLWPWSSSPCMTGWPRGFSRFFRLFRDEENVDIFCSPRSREILQIASYQPPQSTDVWYNALISTWQMDFFYKSFWERFEV